MPQPTSVNSTYTGYASQVESIPETVFVSLAVGEGIRSIDDVQRLLLSGAGKVCINTPALLNPSLAGKSADRFGTQSIVVAIDAKHVGIAEVKRKPVTVCDDVQ